MVTSTGAPGARRTRRAPPGIATARAVSLFSAALVLATPARTAGQDPASPGARRGLSATTIAEVERLLAEKMTAERIPGLSVAIAVDGELAWSAGYGTADVENAVPATPLTAYRTASIGKPMTATAVMQLVEDGRIDLDAPVQRYCPAFPRKRWPVTTRHLLGHTSGIRHYGGPREAEELFNTVHWDSVVEALSIFADDSLLFEPGTRYLYSTFGYNVLGCVVEGASGRSFLDYMAEHVFRPAGMTRTRDDDPAAIVPHRAAGYVIGSDGKLGNSRAVDMSSKLPAGGFITTAEDLARFGVAVVEHRLVRAETLDLMLEPVRLADGTTVGYGLGWALFPGETWYGEREAFHGGGTPTVSGMLYLLPDRRFAVAILANLEGVTDRTALAAHIARAVLHLGDPAG